MTREDARIDEWAKVIAPSNELRKWFNHDPARWSEFQMRYRAELASDEARAKLTELRQRAREGKVTLVFAARDETFCNATALAALLTDKRQA